MDFKGKVAIVTGSGSPRGIGREITRVLAEKGCSVVVADMNLEGAQRNAEELKNEFGCDSMAVSANVTDMDSVTAMFEAVFAKYGRIDILCNNAGITQPVTIEDMTKDDFMRIMNVNLVGTFVCSKLVVPYMVKAEEGCVINTSSIGGLMGVANQADYCASKSGLIGMTRALAMEFGKQNIRFNCICPGMIWTDMLRGVNQDEVAALAQSIPMGKIGDVDDIAAAMEFLIKDKYMTGQYVSPNGGIYMP